MAAKLFFSYSHADEALRDQLERQLAILRRQGVIETWHDRRIGAGREFAHEIDRHLEAADIILLLVSSDFLASDYCHDIEMARALERHDEGSAIVIPVILRDCLWQRAPFGRLLATPPDGRPVTRWPDRDQALTEVARAIENAADQPATTKSPVASPAPGSASPTQSGPVTAKTGPMPYLGNRTNHVADRAVIRPTDSTHMAGYRATEIRKPASEAEFEENCVVLFRELVNDSHLKRLGTRGQSQHGIDLIGHRDGDPNRIVGVQCKLRLGNSKLSLKEVKEEINAALGHEPALSEYFIVTTSKDDTKLDQYALQVMQEQEAAGRRIQITVWGWGTLQERVNQSEAAKKAFDPGFSPSIASQERKLDALLIGQARQATKEQVATLAASVGRQEPDASVRLPANYADRELREGLSRALRRRGFARTDAAAELAALAKRAIDGDLSLGSPLIRAEVCDRAARSNAAPATLAPAHEFRDAAARLDPSRDLFIANALLKEADGDPDAALRELKSRNDSDTRSALLTALVRHQGGAAALRFVRSEGLKATDLNAAGGLNLILQEIEEGEFDTALADIGSVPDSYFDQCPVLHLVRAQTALASILPSDQRAALFQGLPMNPRMLQLAGGPKSQDKIRAAGRDVQALLAQIGDLNLDYLRDFLSEFELWLRLEDGDTREAARAQVAKEIAEPALTLKRVRLALAYDVPFDQEALLRTLASRKEVGGWTSDERFAAFLIALESGDPAKITDFFDKHHDDLFAQSDIVRAALAGIEIEALARAGRFEEARRHIALHSGSHLSTDQVKDISEIVAHIEQGDEVEGLRLRYEGSKSLTDLRVLVGALRSRRDTKQLAVYAPTLAHETKTREDFDLATKALFRGDRYVEVVALAEALPDLFALDDEFASIKGWSLFHLGKLREAAEIAQTLYSRRDVASDRELAINTSVETGDWGRLQGILAREAGRTDTLPASDLARLARLAHEMTSPYVERFRDAALAKAPDDPNVYLAAYMLATERGEEYHDARAHQWFEKAVRLSGSDGPVRSASMRELIDHSSGWNERTEKIDRMLREAEIPLFLVAQALRRRLVDLTLGQALRNSNPNDSRIRYPVFGFSGAQPARDLLPVRSTAFDVTALITLDWLGLLGAALAHFDQVTLAPTTLSFLFVERQLLRLHQPSEVAKANRLQRLIASGQLKGVSGGVPDDAVSREIGRDLAQLLALAQREEGIVVRSAPVTKLGTLMEESADMSAFAPVLADTSAVLSFLKQAGKIDADVERHAELYLRQVDAGWASSREIAADSKLYLDDLSVTYLDYVGLLEPLIQTVTAVFVHADVERQVEQTLQHAQHVDDLLAAIERIRAAVADGVQSGHIRFSGRRVRENEDEEDDASSSPPTLDLMSDLSGIQAVIADDRCLNKLPNWTDSSGNRAAACTTLEVLETLRASGKITQAEYWRARHRLRLAGYYAVPVELEELRHFMAAAPLAGGELRETPELKAVRESLALPVINKAYLAAEEPWLARMRFAVFQALRDVWAETPDLDRAEAEANWLLSIMPDPREWCVHPENDTAWVAAKQQVAVQMGLLLVFVAGPAERRRRYFAWLDEKLVAPLRKDHPETWGAALDFLRGYILKLAEGGDET